MYKTLPGARLQDACEVVEGHRMRNFVRGLGDIIDLPKLVLALVGFAAVAGCAQTDGWLCGSGSCGWSDVDTSALTSLADLPATPPPDASNKYVGLPAAEQ